MDNSFEGYGNFYEGAKPPKRKGRFWIGFLTGILSALALSIFVSVIAFTLFYLYRRGDTRFIPSQTEAVDATGTIDVEALTGEDADEKIETIAGLIEKNYYRLEDIDTEAMQEAMYEGMVSALGDKYSTYYSPAELAQIMEGTQGIYSGIGAYVSMDAKTNYPVVSGTMKDTPAEAAGLLMNDIIYEVDGFSTEGMELEEVVSRIKGPEGTDVTLTIIREGQELKVEVERRKISSPTVSSEYYEDERIGYIAITEFDDVTLDQFIEAKEDLEDQGMEALIIDLRGNPGGNLSTVCEIARQLLPEGVIVSTRDRDGNTTEYSCDGRKRFKLPLAVLVNGYSASASEILAGAIKDYGIGTLVGTMTYGKGVVQQIISLSDGSAVKLTVSSYYTPNGTNINGVGIEPDEEIELDAEAYNSEEHYDSQL
ncbi:MAG: S41 family peptidase, partial [Lachnospiraceae bacterium]|nr:S41 family peptidase [Lachnospiraceae bacterium]